MVRETANMSRLYEIDNPIRQMLLLSNCNYYALWVDWLWVEWRHSGGQALCVCVCVGGGVRVR